MQGVTYIPVTNGFTFLPGKNTLTGVEGVAIGVPAVLAQNGVQQIIELKLAEEEQQKFRHSVEVIRANIARLP
jgi:malate/lactate dehydrogenase